MWQASRELIRSTIKSGTQGPCPIVMRNFVPFLRTATINRAVDKGLRAQAVMLQPFKTACGEIHCKPSQRYASPPPSVNTNYYRIRDTLIHFMRLHAVLIHAAHLNKLSPCHTPLINEDRFIKRLKIAFLRDRERERNTFFQSSLWGDFGFIF